jgi:hypothetical protein
MATEEQIRELAFSIWEQEGHPIGKDIEHYFRAKQILEAQEAASVIEIAPKPPTIELAPQTPPVELAPPSERKKRSSTRRKKR